MIAHNDHYHKDPELKRGLNSGGVLVVPERMEWLDYARGWCIILVVTMHSTLGVGVDIGAVGWLHEIVSFAKPFRVPDFFLLSGLMIGRALHLPVREFLDKKVLHFVYFYAIWVFIVLIIKAGVLGLSGPVMFLQFYAQSFIEPFSSMWYIHLLPFLFLIARLTRNAPPALVIMIASIMHILASLHQGPDTYTLTSVMTGWSVIDNICMFGVYFLLGHYLASYFINFTKLVSAHLVWCAISLAVWAVVNYLSVKTGIASIPGFTLLFGIGGAFAIAATSSCLAKARLLPWLGYCGRNSLAIYLAFTIPMAAVRTLLLKTMWISSVGLICLIVTVAAIVTPLLLNYIIIRTPLFFLFLRPRWASIRAAKIVSRGSPTSPIELQSKV